MKQITVRVKVPAFDIPITVDLTDQQLIGMSIQELTKYIDDQVTVEMLAYARKVLEVEIAFNITGVRSVVL